VFVGLARTKILDKKEIMKKATIEILEEGETIFGSRTNGDYFVRRYEDGEEMGGGFFKTMEEAETEVREYQQLNG
jgi:hypothetical protein